MTAFPPSRRLSPADLPRLRELADHCRAEDGLAPFNDQTLALIGQRRAEGVVVPGDDGNDGRNGLDAAAVHADGVWEIAVAPAARRRGLGRRLLNTARRHAPDPCWAHGDHPAARRLAAEHRLEAQRALHRMTRPGISELPAAAAPPLPPGARLADFSPGDEAAWLALNAAAFAHDPDQGHLAIADLRARFVEPWFRRVDLRILWAEGTAVGTCWVKQTELDAEIYVLGIHPHAQGRGLGRALLHDALTRHPRAAQFSLYVDGANRGAIALYRRVGFQVASTDVLWGDRVI